MPSAGYVDDAIIGVVAAFHPTHVWYQSWPLPNLRKPSLTHPGGTSQACAARSLR